MATKKRVVWLDGARALSMLWIVGFWHLQDYLQAKNLFTNGFFQCLTAGALATFACISGLFMPNSMSNARDILTFYKKRLLRIYPLFFLSCLSLLMIGIIQRHGGSFSSISQFILTITGTVVFFKPLPQTIWYISMMIFFYLLTPLIGLLRTKKLQLITLTAIYTVIILSYYFLNTDPRLLIFFPMYFLTLVFSKDIKRIYPEKFSWKILLTSAILSVGTSFLISWQDNYLTQIAAGLCLMPMFLECGKLISMPLPKVSLFIAYASMCAYLFHRQIYGMISHFTGSFHIITAFLVFLPAVIFISYGIQFIYDWIIKKMTARKAPLAHEKP